MAISPHLLITGASGLLGGHLVEKARKEGWKFTGTRQNKDSAPFSPCIAADLCNLREIENLFEKTQPSTIIHAAACTDLHRCEKDPRWAEEIHVTATRHLVQLANQTSARIIYMSTDSVFSSDEKRAPFKETDSPHPVNVYARTKEEGEAVVLNEAKNGLVVRGNLFGWNRFQKGASLAEWALAQLAQGQEINGFTDVWFNPLYTGKLADLLLHLARSEQQGLLHLGAVGPISKYDFLQKLATAWGHDPNLVKPLPMPTSTKSLRRPRFTCLDISLALKNLPAGLPTAEQGLEEMKADWQSAALAA